MPYLEIRQIPHYYEWVTAYGDRPTGRPVMVYVHGWGGSGRYWESTARALSPEFDGLLYDLRGFGRSKVAALTESGPTTLYELEAYADDLAEMLDALNLERVYLNAHSMGASMAVLFLNRYPERVERAILTCSGIFEYDKNAFEQFYKFGGYVVKFRPQWLAKIPFVERMFMARFLHRPIAIADQKAFLEDFLLADYHAALNTIFASVSKKATEVMPQEFAQVQVPTLLISGEKDIIIPADMGEKAAALSEQVKYVVIPKTAHFPMLEDPQTYLAQVREFLAQEVYAG
ncbi:alpha/beta fold hydrolase [Leptolyngbya sp. FACHB-261]|uniref:alpha/beta fold hydrolase n=1 Tax=Leptolyngbya sp. FACHB-261 TaxID=2692806 RepID=UPI0016899FFB|nr:alpha/beta hydrolase [Leptolyngbya sp. FACHB-261]MBD2104348.1 alpha/beta hydrolase [Leptolyngbya sp. FACHB-261]